MTIFCKRPLVLLLLALASHVAAADGADQSSAPRVSNAELSACVGGSIERFDDGTTPVGEVARTIWKTCRGDESQAVADSATAADMLHLRIRAMVTEHRNSVVVARAAKAKADKAGQPAKTE